MKVGKRKQQGRIQPGKTEPSKPKETCPVCQDVYLKTLYVRDTQYRKIGMVCPICYWSRIDKRRGGNQ